MNYILFDTNNWENLLPLTYTRPISDIRIGILKINEKWDNYLNDKCSYLTKEYLQKKFPLVSHDKNILINSSLLPNKELVEIIKSIETNTVLMFGDTILAVNTNDINSFNYSELDKYNTKNLSDSIPVSFLDNVWDVFSKNGDELIADFELLTKGRQSEPISKTNRVLGNNIFVEKGAKIECSILNSTTGPIYIGKDAEVMEGAIVRGPFALCEHSTLKLAAKIYGPTTIGPHSKVGGEVNNCVIIGYSNKGHDGFLGNSVLGEWCNIGADSNNSNLKNNYADVRLWNYPKERFVKTGLQFCGLIMGDHSKCGINTMFNTGTVVGVNANIYGAGFPRNFIPCFSWGGSLGFTEYNIKKAFEVANKVFERREMEFDEIEQEILTHIYTETEKFRLAMH